MRLSAARLSAYSRLFSSAVLRELASRGKSPLFRRLAEQSLLPDGTRGLNTVGDAFQAAFEVLRVGAHRDEYIYRAALAEKVLLGTHSLNTASMLTEFRVGDCKADLAILNGTATVYEIKSERDSLSRLARQLDEYQKVFAKIYVIAGENHVRGVEESTPSHVGVMQLSSRYHITTIREAKDRAELICPVTIFDSIRVAEATKILSSLGSEVPVLPNTVLRAELRKRFAQLQPLDVHRAMVTTLKKTRNLASLGELVDSLPSCLSAAALSIPFRKSERHQLVTAIETDFEQALRWE